MINDEWLRFNNIQLYTLFRLSKGLITDYSSVVFDYLLMNKPIYFYIPDFDSYNDSRGFVFDNIHKMMPGYKFSDFNELKDYIFDIDIFAKERARINELCNDIKDGSACDNILAYAFNLIN